MDQIAEQLATRGYSVVPGFFSDALTTAAREDLRTLRQSGSMKRAGLGTDKSLHDEIRRDEIFWLGNGSAVQTDILSKMDQLRTELNRALFAGLKTVEFHYAAYPPGGFYRRHVDAIRGENARVLSLVIYLNEAWRTENGGQLRLHTADGQVDVEPRAGTMVCFRSEDLEHEVLPSHELRLSLTGWFRRF